MALSKVILLVGAGATGTVVLRNSKVSEILNDVSQVLSKHLKEDGDGSSSGGDGRETRALVAQVNQLTQELRHLANASRPITVVNGTSSSSPSWTNLSSLMMPVVVVGAVGYAYMWWRGFQWTNIMYVTRKHMSNAVATVSKQLEQVSAALQATKRQLTAKLEGVSKTLNDSVEVQGLIKAQVTEVQGEVERATVEIEEVQRLVQGLEVKIDEVQGKQDFANQGIILLCRFVSSLEMFRQPELLQSYHSWTPNRGHHAALERSASTPGAAAAAIPAAGLKELQYFSETLTAGIIPAASSRDILPRDTAIANSNNGGVLGVMTNGNNTDSKCPPNLGIHRAFSLARPFVNS
ncbi:hypothetical protein BDL97_16G037700 [Sphagnum fallax]|jgi:hypothetical protein|nr:hypothetical protein BDL97_16G037700 [Sphagnum fallax]